MSGSLSATASNASLLDGTGSVGFTTTGSFTTMSGSVSTRVSQIESVYATTGSNSFRATQSITGSLTVTGQIIAQTLNVQQVTSSIIYSSGSNVFGCDINSRQVFTGSFYQTGSSACFSNVIKVGADTTISNRSITLAGFPTSICFGNGQTVYDNAGGGLAINGQSSIQFLTCATASLNLSSAGYLGIGTTTPCRELHAKGEILFQSRNATPVNNSMYRFIPRSTEGAFEFQLMSDNTSCENTVWVVCRNAQTVTSFSILNSNVGIGTCAPESKLHMYNANNPLSIKIQRTTVPVFLSDVQLAGTTAGAVWSHNLENTSNGSFTWSGFGNTVYAGSAIMLNADTATSYITLHTAASVNTNPTERLRIGGAGTFGFNCTGIAARTMVVKGVTGCYIVAEFIEPAGVHSIEVYPNKSCYNLISSDYMSGGTFLPLSLSGREATSDLVLSPTGRVGVGNDPGCLQLFVYQSGCTISGGNVCFTPQAKGIEVYNPNSGTTDNVVGVWFSTGPHKTGIASGRTNAAANWEVDLRFYTHPTTIGNLDNTYENMRLYGGGNLTINGTLTQNGGLSDCRQKENLVRISNPLDIISCIGGYNFEWKEGSPSRRDFMCIVEDAGLIAQEVETVMPNIVRETKWDCLKTLNYNGITALLVEGMKAQQCTINALKSCLGIA
jgi:hypothetical protein